jgi:hypothetical protein
MRQRSSSSFAYRIAGRLLVDALRFVSLGVRSRSQLAAENLFLRKQLALYRERQVKSRRADDSTRITLVVLALCFANIPANVGINNADPHIGVRTKSFRASGDVDDSIAHRR